MEHKWVDRRDFLFMGSAAAVGVAATSVSAGTLDAITRIEGASPVLSVGFVPADDCRPVAADSLRFNDASLGRGPVRVTVHGMWRGNAATPAPAVHVSAFFPAAGEPLPFIAWSSTASTSPRVSFTMDLASQRALSLGVERERLVSNRVRRGRFAHLFTEDRQVPTAAVLERGGGLCTLGADGTKLRRGTYFIALRNTVWDRTPDWSSFEFDGAALRDGSDSVLRRGEARPTFDFVAVTVDAA